MNNPSKLDLPTAMEAGLFAATRWSMALRARLKGLIREEIRQTVADEQDWEDEVQYLIRLFGR